jgi:hypothetical protein
LIFFTAIKITTETIKNPLSLADEYILLAANGLTLRWVLVFDTEMIVFFGPV